MGLYYDLKVLRVSYPTSSTPSSDAIMARLNMPPLVLGSCVGFSHVLAVARSTLGADYGGHAFWLKGICAGAIDMLISLHFEIII